MGSTSGAITDDLPDLLGLSDLVSDDEATIARTVRDLVADELRPHVREWFEAGSTPVRDLARRFGELGLLGMKIDGYGCAGTTALAYGLACAELEAGDSGLRSIASVQSSLAMHAIHAFGDEAQRERWLPSMATGETIGCFGLTEPEAGSDPGAMRTRARRDGSDWLLRGTKMWITNGSVADVAVVWARTDEDDHPVRGFLVPTDTPGFTATDIGGKLSLRASTTSELSLDDVRLPADAMLPEGRGLAGPLSCLTEARFGIIFGALGAARDCLSATLRYCSEREIFGRALGSFQLTQAKLADLVTEYEKGMLLALRLGHLRAAGPLEPAAVSMGKLNSTRVALDIARECRTILGGAGITLEWPVLRHANNLESVLTYEGTAEVHQLVIGQRLTGASAFR